MADKEYSLTLELRDIVKKNTSYKTKQEGFIAGILYGPNRKSTPVKSPIKETLKIINNQHLINKMLTANFVPESKDLKVLIKDFQVDPVKNKLLHVDFYEVDLTKEVDVTVPIILVGTAIGTKKGGLLELIMREVEIRCLPTNIPDHIEANVENLDIGFSLHLRDVTFPEGIQPLFELKRTVAIVSEPEKEEVETSEGEEAEIETTNEAKDTEEKK